MNSTPLNFIIALIGFILVCIGYRGLTTGIASIKGLYKIPKKEKPKPYWITVICFIVIGVAGIIFGLISA